MAQSNFEERIDTYEIESTNVMTGDRDRIRYLYYQLKMSMAKAKQIDIIVSFLMESGVRMLLNDMKRALDRGVRIRILTGNYLGITQPSALYLIKSELGDRVDLRLYNETSRSFHPKSYIFHYGSSNEIYIGSSNISKSALTSGIEWNYRFSDTLDKKNYELFYATFEDLFLNHSIIINDEELKRYSKAWKKPAVSRDLAKYDATEDGEDRNTENVRMLYRPRGAQISGFIARLWAKWFMEKQKNKYQKEIEGYKNELAVELAKCRTLNEKILHKEIFIYDEEFKIYKEIMPGFRKVSKSVLDYLVIIKLLVEKGIEDTTEGKEKIQKAYASAYEMTFAYYDLVMDEGIFIEEQTYVMLMNFFAHCEKILRINLNPENWKDMKWDEIIDNQINEENKITCHLRNKIRSC